MYGQDSTSPSARPTTAPRPAEKWDRLGPSPGQQQATVRNDQQDVADPVDAHQDGQAESQAAQRGGDPGRGPAGRQRVDDQAEPAKEQDLRQRLAEGRPAGVLLRQGEGEDQSRQWCPPWPDQPGGQAAEREHRGRPEHRCDQDRRAHPADPETGRENHRQPGHELRHDAPTDLVVRGAGKNERVVEAAERRARLRDRQ